MTKKKCGAPERVSAAQLVRAKQRIDKGVPLRRVAAEIGLSHTGLKRALETRLPKRAQWKTILSFEDEVSSSTPVEAAEPFTELTPEEITLEWNRRWLTEMIATVKQGAERLDLEGESVEARQWMQLAMFGMNILARVTRRDQDDDGVLTLAHLELNDLRVAARDKLMAAAMRSPLTCHHCQRPLTIRWGKTPFVTLERTLLNENQN